MAGAMKQRFRTALLEAVQSPNSATVLREASLAERLGDWTSALTIAAVHACEALGFRASAKGHKLELLPVQRSEYLGLDVMAFPEGAKRWRFPSIVMELENQRSPDAIAYSLWKVLSVRADLRVVFCYRREREEAAELVRHLREEVVEAMGIGTRAALEGETLLVVGTRTGGATFPDGFFIWWELEKNTGRFMRLT